MENLRSPICSVLGHVDHGKSSILDAIRGTNILATEAGGITQAIGASIIPLEVIKKKCGTLLNALKMKFTIPGLLFIDTPGHAAFTNLRKRGGNLADIAVLVIDINEGFKPQTEEAVEILKSYKTPFVIAANKIDLIPGYRKQKDNFSEDIKLQSPQVQQEVENRIYRLVGTLFDKFHVESERYDRVDFTKQAAIVPCSAKLQIGLPELLMVITGLAQKYLEESLKVNVSGYAKGTILEVKDEKGLGTTLDVIIYDGNLKVNDIVVIGGIEKPIITKVKAMFQPAPLAEMRDKKSKFVPVKKVTAATGVKLSCPDLKEVIAGMPIVSCDEAELEEAKQRVQGEIDEVIIETDKDGIIIKADTLGSLEALTGLLQQKGIPIRKATVGPISKKDLSDAEANYEQDPLLSVILGFNIPQAESTEKVRIITHDVIYRLIEDFEKWREEARKAEEVKQLDMLVRPCRIEVLKNCIFRESNPCILGVEVLAGTLRAGTPLMKGIKHLTIIKSMQKEKENLPKAERGTQLAISLPKITAGRQVHEGDILYTDIPEDDFRKMKKLKQYLRKDEIEILKEIAEMHRKENAVWGV